jgi:hypothetical protein
LTRRAGFGERGGERHAAVEKDFHRPCRKRSPSALSSASIAASSSLE